MASKVQLPQVSTGPMTPLNMTLDVIMNSQNI